MGNLESVADGRDDAVGVRMAGTENAGDALGEETANWVFCGWGRQLDVDEEFDLFKRIMSCFYTFG